MSQIQNQLKKKKSKQKYFQIQNHHRNHRHKNQKYEDCKTKLSWTKILPKTSNQI